MAILQQIVTQFMEVHGREPTQDELKDVLRKITSAANDAEEEGDDADADEQQEQEGGAAAAAGGSKRAREGEDADENTGANKKTAS